ncbi:hypothetical protein HYS93_02205 [Candidatus Daviesbacteria bacterium]|nr:hypothetical protein [Candidatus Daviesbacteria bacterium]
MSSTQFWVGALVPPLVKWLNPYLKKFFKLSEFDSQTQERVASKQYPFFYGALYTLWVLTLLGSGITVLLLMMIYGPAFFPGKSYTALILIGLINMIGSWMIFGAILDALFWQLSPENFRDYVKFRQLKSGWEYDIKQQIITLFKIGFIYYLLTAPIILYLLY